VFRGLYRQNASQTWPSSISAQIFKLAYQPEKFWQSSRRLRAGKCQVGRPESVGLGSKRSCGDAAGRALGRQRRPPLPAHCRPSCQAQQRAGPSPNATVVLGAARTNRLLQKGLLRVFLVDFVDPCSNTYLQIDESRSNNQPVWTQLEQQRTFSAPY
jgi:hypothetical protein